MAVHQLFYALLELHLHGNDCLVVRIIGLALAVRLDLLQLIDSLLELELSIFEILLRLLLLLFQKFKFALPERAVLVIVVDLVLQLNRELIILASESVHLTCCVDLLLFAYLHQLLVLIPELDQLALVDLDLVVNFIFVILQLEAHHCPLTLVVCIFLNQPIL